MFWRIKLDIKLEGNILLENHKKLYKQLIEIPDRREIEFIEEIEESVKVGKPRFKVPKYQWPSNLLVELRDHLQNIWNFFNKYSYWFDDTLIPLLYTGERRASKKSIIFLLEEDVWNTDEVYGKYIIDENQDEITISYSRRERNIKQITLKTKEASKLKEWICSDAIRQIKNQFAYLWEKLETEMKVCVDEIFHKPLKFTLKPNYLKDQLDKTIEIYEQCAEAGLLNLGRIVEHWLLNNLGMKSAPLFFDKIREAEIVGLINKNEIKLLRNIRNSYNNLKHKTYYKIETKDVKIMIENFSHLFHS